MENLFSMNMELAIPSRIPFNRPSLEGREIEHILAAIESGKLAGNGRFTFLCQEHIEKTTQAEKVFLTTSGTDALEMCALLCGIVPGDEIIMPSFTFVSTANAFCLRGGVPVFVDIREKDLNMDPDLVERAVTDRTKAIVVVHYAGVACDMEKIMAIAAKYNLFIVEDAAHAYLSIHKDRHLGTWGDFGVFSFHETKNFICGEGGALLVNRSEHVLRAEVLWEKGTNRSQFFRGEVDKYTWVDVGSSFLPSDLTAAFLYGQLEKQEAILARRRKIFNHYHKLLTPLALKKWFSLPGIPKDGSINYHMYYFLTRDVATRKKLLNYLRSHGIGAVFHYVPLHTSPYAKSLGINLKLSVTEDVAKRIVRLPFYNTISPETQSFIVQTIAEFFEKE